MYEFQDDALRRLKEQRNLVMGSFTWKCAGKGSGKSIKRLVVLGELVFHQTFHHYYYCTKDSIHFLTQSNNLIHSYRKPADLTNEIKGYAILLVCSTDLLQQLIGL